MGSDTPVPVGLEVPSPGAQLEDPQLYPPDEGLVAPPGLLCPVMVPSALPGLYPEVGATASGLFSWGGCCSGPLLGVPQIPLVGHFGAVVGDVVTGVVVAGGVP